MYRRKGFWQAAFGAPRTALDVCDGVSVTLAVTEGSAYAWGGAEWSGTQVFDAAALDKLLGMKVGDVSDATRIESGLRAVHGAYGAKGYVEQASSFEPRLDDQSRRATFAMTVVEGPQFHMGTLEVEGIRESDAAALARRWRLKAGDVYDDSYAQTYRQDELLELRTASGARPVLETQLDLEHRVVNVKVVFR